MTTETSTSRAGEHSIEPRGLSIDIGCGGAKKPGTIGLDIVPAEGVDHVLDITSERFPFEDGTVSNVFSAHCLEHLKDPTHVLQEISRISEDGARVEIWLPYGWNDDAFLLGHLTVWNEEWFMHMCHHHVPFWQPVLGARWRLKELVFHVDRLTAMDLRFHGITVEFALRYMKNVAIEMCAIIEIDKHSPVPAVGDPLGAPPARFFSHGRKGVRQPLEERRIERLLRWKKRLKSTFG